MNYLIYGNSYRLLDDEIKKIIQDKKYTSYYLSEVPVQDILETYLIILCLTMRKSSL